MPGSLGSTGSIRAEGVDKGLGVQRGDFGVRSRRVSELRKLWVFGFGF